MHLDRCHPVVGQPWAAFGVLESVIGCDNPAVLVLSLLVEVKLHHTLLSCFVVEVPVHSPAADVAVVVVLHSHLAVLRYHIAALVIADGTDRSAARSLSHHYILDSVVVELGWRAVCHRGPAVASSSAPAMLEVAQVCYSSSSSQHDLVVVAVVRRCSASGRLAVCCYEMEWLCARVVLTSGSAWL